MSCFHVFTTMLVRNGEPRFLDEHLARLKDHAAHFGIPYPGDETLQETILSCQRRLASSVTASGWPLERFKENMDASLRWHDKTCAGMTYLLRVAIDVAGNISNTTRDLNLAKNNNTRIIITDIKVDPRFAAFKTSSSEPYRKARELVAQHNAFEALLIDEEGYVVDGSRSSPLLYCDGVLVSLEGGLKGITREKVLIEAASLGIEVRHEKRKAHELVGTLLVAGSGIGLLAASPIDDARIAKLINTGNQPHPMRNACKMGAVLRFQQSDYVQLADVV